MDHNEQGRSVGFFAALVVIFSSLFSWGCSSYSFTRKTTKPDGSGSETRASHTALSGKETADLGTNFLDGASSLFAGPLGGAILGATGLGTLSVPVVAWANARASRRRQQIRDDEYNAGVLAGLAARGGPDLLAAGKAAEVKA